MTARTKSPTTTTRVARPLPGGYAGKLLRVNLSTGKVWTQPWGPEEMREQLGGVGLGARILYDEVGPKAHWDHPENRLIMATGPLAGLPVWGTGGLTVVTRGAMTGGATSTQANGFFGAALKYSGYDAIVIQGQARKLSYLYINDDVVEIRDAAQLAGKDTWETQQALEQEHGLSGHRMSVYSIGPAGEHLVRFAAIHGDYGHVASKNGCGAVMGKKRLKAVCIVSGTKALAAYDARGLVQAADDIAHDLKTDPAASTLYNWGTLPGVVNLYKLGALPIKNYTTNVSRVDLGEWEPTKLRDGFDHRGHQCNACGMHHCHIQVIRTGPHAGERVDEPEYEGWSGAGWQIGLTDREAVTWLNTRIDRACVDVNEFGWVCGWVMECMEKGYLTEEQVGFRLAFGDADGAYRLLQMISHREGFGAILAEGTKRAAEAVGGAAAKCAVYTRKGAAPRGHDHRGRWEEMLDTCTASTGTLETGNPVHPTEVGQRGLAGGLLVHLQDPDGEPRPCAVGGHRLGVHARGGHALRPAHGRDPARLQPALRHRAGGGVPVGALRLEARRWAGQGPRGHGPLGADGRQLVRQGRLRSEDRQAQEGHAPRPRPRLAGQGAVVGRAEPCRTARRAKHGDTAERSEAAS
ncbi:MAG: hypothetical protein HYV93_07375 [Candidatus Rokubacteria bacterium]|nr:hypothetical protein [Candidatus Rokubacteria bacterium]